MSAPSYMVPPQYTSTPQPPRPPQSISPVEQAILDLTKLVGNFVEAQRTINAQLSQRIDTLENNVNKRIDGLQSEMEHKLNILQESISKLTNQLVYQKEENPKKEYLIDTIVEEQYKMQDEAISPLLTEESNGNEAGEEPQKSTDQPQNSPLPVYILPTPVANPKPATHAPKAKSNLSLLAMQNFKKLVAFVQNFATTSKTQAAAYIAWHSGLFGCRFGFGAPESRHF